MKYLPMVYTYEGMVYRCVRPIPLHIGKNSSSDLNSYAISIPELDIWGFSMESIYIQVAWWLTDHGSDEWFSLVQYIRRG